MQAYQHIEPDVIMTALETSVRLSVISRAVNDAKTNVVCWETDDVQWARMGRNPTLTAKNILSARLLHSSFLNTPSLSFMIVAPINPSCS